MKEIYRLLLSLLVGFISFWIMFGITFGQCFGSRGNDYVCQVLGIGFLVVPVVAFLATFLFLRYKAKQTSQQQTIVGNQQIVPVTTDNSVAYIVIAYMCLVVPLLGYLAPVVGLIFGFIGYRKTKSQNRRIFALVAIILLSLRFLTYVIAILRS